MYKIFLALLVCGVHLEEVDLTDELTSGVRMPYEVKALLADTLNSRRRASVCLISENAHLDAPE